MAATLPLADALAAQTREGELYERYNGDLDAVLRLRPPLPDPRRRAAASARSASTAAARLHGPVGLRGRRAVRSDREEAVLPRLARRRCAFSFGMLGCDLHCGYCQNWVTSQALRDPEAMLRSRGGHAASSWCATRVRLGARAVVSTYNEPLITAEWAVAVFKEAQRGRPGDRRSSRTATPRPRCSSTCGRGSICTRWI